MTNKPGIVITGASGRMGQMLVQSLAGSDRARLVGCVERTGHAWIGRDVGECMGGAPVGVLVTDDPLEAFARAQAVIDFTAPAATVEFAKLAAQARAVHVIGTTGLEPADHARLDLAAHHAVIVQAGNMSLGVNLLTRLTQKVAAALDADWDVEIVEAHHRMKVDAPSGTALLLGEAAAKGRRIDLATSSERGRDGITGARQTGTIGFASLRSGTVPGDHTVHLFGEYERIALSHLAEDRMIFARGAVRGCQWLIGKPAGRYQMAEVLGL